MAGKKSSEKQDIFTTFMFLISEDKATKLFWYKLRLKYKNLWLLFKQSVIYDKILKCFSLSHNT